MESQTNVTKTSDLRTTVKQLARLVEVSLTLNSTLDPDKLLQYIIKTAAELLDCETASVLLYDETHGELRFAASSGSDPEQLSLIPVPLGSSIAGSIFRQNKPVIINDLSKDPRHFNRVGEEIQFKPRSLVGVPMRIRDKVTGVLEGLNKCHGEFTNEDANLLSIIASQAAVAIHNARLMESLQGAYDELSQIDKIKNNFISIASHELRTPLGLILGYAQFLKEDAEGEMAEQADVVLKSAVQMRMLIEDMTNITMLQMGSLDLDLDSIPIQKVITAAYKEVEPTSQAKNHTVNLELPPEALPIMADARKLESVFLNLLNNAIRFTPDGGQISIRARKTGDGIQVEVQDSGIGIPKDELDRIFEKFYQVEDHMTRTYGGMGMGLSIVQGIVELHKGKVWAESEGVDQGTTFKVVLPAA